ncbi:DUF2878 domain-containing protein [Oceanisphaera avium]|uniref:DUF2878 domain-containing protein n=1 Tax=Oceanisphaera avium TaxID=1903694 RepID=A0A1Y0CWI1_9GAMM|nr:DUF2878 domain-containing protein [Oceanisphaera avium]ART79578.1 hypothetical protein CBP12_04935 [Oceanisphaera avium]
MSKWQWAQLVGFYGFWLLAVMGQNLVAWLLALLLMAHFIVTPNPRLDFKVVSLALLGLSVDVVLTLSGVFSFSQWPVWLGLLWVGFVLTLGHSMAWLATRPRWQQALLGAVTGPSSYITGWRLGAVDLPLGPGWTLLLLAPLWSLLLITLVRLDVTLRRHSDDSLT